MLEKFSEKTQSGRELFGILWETAEGSAREAIANILRKTGGRILGLKEKTQRGAYLAGEAVDRISHDPSIEGGAVELGRSIAQRLHLIGPAVSHRIPRLIDDFDDNADLVRAHLKTLKAPTNARQPFSNQISNVAISCFHDEIPAERLIEFFESNEVLSLLVKNQIELAHRRFSPADITAAVIEALDSMGEKFISASSVIMKKEVDTETEQGIKQDIEKFSKGYSPGDPERTIGRCIEELIEKYPDYRVEKWILENVIIFVNIVRNRISEKCDAIEEKDRHRHIANVVYGIYEREGRTDPARFIRIFIRTFLKMEKGGILYINLEKLGEVADQRLARIQSKQFSLEQLKAIMISACVEEASKMPISCKKIVIEDSNGVIREEDFSDKEELMDAIRKCVSDNTPILSPLVHPENLLIDPESCSPEIERNYMEWFSGKKKERVFYYRAYMRQIFTKRSKERKRKERFSVIERRVSEILANVNNYLDYMAEKLEYPTIMLSEKVRGINDFRQLAKIAYDEDQRYSKIDRFEARRKIELAKFLYKCQTTDNLVYRNHAAREIQAKLEAQHLGNLQVDRESPLREIKYFDMPPVEDAEDVLEGAAVIHDFTRDDEQGELSERKKILKLIPANFNGHRCWLLPPVEEEEAGKSREYIGKKKFFGMLTKVIHDNVQPDEITDLNRMTFVVDDINQMLALHENIERYYSSFGRALKVENKYGTLIDVKSLNIRGNDTSSENYKALRYVATIEIPDATGKNDVGTNLEIRILLTEDCVSERSVHAKTSHQKYDYKRSRRVAERLIPKEIYGEIFYEEHEEHILPLSVFRQQKLKGSKTISKIYQSS